MKIAIVRWQHRFFYFGDDDLEYRKQLRSRLVMAFSNQQDAQFYCDAIISGAAPLPLGLNPFIGFRHLRKGSFSIGVGRENVEEDTSFFGIASLTSLPEEELLASLDQLKMARPARPDYSVLKACQSPKARERAREFFAYDWDEWWETTAVLAAEWQRHGVVKRLDRIQLFEIIETDLEI